MAYTLDFVNKWLELFGDQILKEKEFITELDAPIGDSDHGMNMARGIENYRASIAKLAPKDPAGAFKTLAMMMLSKVGGSSGPLYGSAFLAISMALKGKNEFTDKDLAEAIAKGFASIESRGKSHEGEKTMDDVWGPVSRDLANGTLTKEKIDSYVKATGPIKATKGRASYLGDRSIGHIDPGSYSSGIFFKSMLEAKDSSLTKEKTK